MKVLHGFDSTVNDVTLIQDQDRNGKILVKKVFRKYAKKTGIYIDDSRLDMEAGIIGFLRAQGLSNQKIDVPNIIEVNRNDRYILFDYIRGQKVIELDEQCWPEDALWIELIRLLVNLNNIPQEIIISTFGDLLETQRTLQKTIFSYKALNEDLTNSKSLVLCLGDLNLSNILATKDQLYIIDFEFGHWGYIGYDLGQLGGQLQALNVIRNKNAQYIYTMKIIDQKLRQYVAIYGNYLFWKKRFFNYYLKKFKKK